MEKGKQIVILKRKRDGALIPFELTHALALLRLQEKNGSDGWIIECEVWDFKDGEIFKKPIEIKEEESKPVTKAKTKSKAKAKAKETKTPKALDNGNTNGGDIKESKETD